MAKKRKINEYDQNPAVKIKQKYKKKRRVRRLSLLIMLVVVSAIGYYLYSPYSKIHSIEISGNQFVELEELQNALPYHSGDFRAMILCKKIQVELTKLSGVKEVTVKKSLDNVSIQVVENTPIAYQEADGQATIIFDDGTYKNTSNGDLIRVLHSLVRISNFNDETILQQFAKNFSEVDESVRSQISDIYFEPNESDPLKIKMVSDDGKESTLRIDEMVYQLQYYNNIVSNNSDHCYFDFEGSNVYQRACTKKEDKE